MKPLFVVVMVILAACTRGEADPTIRANILLTCFSSSDFGPSTRAGSPDETLISDWSLLIFNSYGDLEEHVYVPYRALNSLSYSTRLLRDVPYTIIATANMGYQLPIHCLADAREYRYPLAHPDEYSRGLPMAVVLEGVLATEQMELRLERLMARVDLRLDRRELAEDVLLRVTEVTVGLCPTSVSLFRGSCVETASQAFQQGFTLRGNDVDALNHDMPDALSGDVSLYLLENCSELHPSYVEIKVAYHSEDYHTDPGDPLSFRISLGEVIRNRVYPLVLAPQHLSGQKKPGKTARLFD